MVLEFIVTSLLPSSYLNDLIERMTNGGIDIMELIEEMNQHYPTMNQVFSKKEYGWRIVYKQVAKIRSRTHM